ncbi:MAG: hypothetical protein ACRDRH_22865 [Pseudonocardia sp.]
MSGSEQHDRQSERSSSGSGEGSGRVVAFSSRRERVTATGCHEPGEPPELVAEIHTVEGPESERLALQQARVLGEVTTWLAHKTGSQERGRAA